MEDEGKKENWDTLAGQLGAEVPESPGTPELPENKVQTESAEPSLGLPAELPRSGPSGWDSLAEEFGIASPELAETPGPSDPPATKPASGSKAVSKSPASGRGKSVAKASSSAPVDAVSKKETSFGVGISGAADDRSSVAASRQKKAPALTGTGSSKASDSQPAHEQAPATEIPATDSRDQSYEPSDDGAVADPSGSQKAESPAAGDAGRTTSFWESIFGPRQETPLPEEPSQETPVPEVVEASTRQEPEVVSDRSGEKSTEKSAEKSAEKSTEKEAGDRSREGAEGGRPRRRSRRRRSRSGKSGQSQSESPSQKTPDARVTEVADDLEDDLEEDLNDDLKDDLEDDLEEDCTLASPEDGSSRSRSSKAKPPSHRNIPAWEDAMAFIVDGNLQTRTERRPASSRSGDRGRPRGRRKKKKS